MNRIPGMNPRQRLVHWVQELERVEALKARAAECVKACFEEAQAQGYDAATLKVVLKLRKMTPEQRRERRALEAIYLGALGMLEGDPLTDEARRRLDDTPPPPPPDTREPDGAPSDAPDQSAVMSAQPPSPPQPTLMLKDPAEARLDGAAAAAAGKRVYDNPYRAGDPCRAAWDEGWCAQANSHGMDTPAAYRRRSDKSPEADDREKDRKPGEAGEKKGAA